MDREIKFRAWIKKDGRMEYQVGVNPYYVSDCDRFMWKHDEVELMQYVELKDKNGKEIYEGDIVRFDKNCCHGDGIIKFGDYYSSCGSCREYSDVHATGFYIQSIKKSCSDYNQGDISKDIELEVIGNLYEN